MLSVVIFFCLFSLSFRSEKWWKFAIYRACSCHSSFASSKSVIENSSAESVIESLSTKFAIANQLIQSTIEVAKLTAKRIHECWAISCYSCRDWNLSRRHQNSKKRNRCTKSHFVHVHFFFIFLFAFFVRFIFLLFVCHLLLFFFFVFFMIVCFFNCVSISRIIFLSKSNIFFTARRSRRWSMT